MDGHLEVHLAGILTDLLAVPWFLLHLYDGAQEGIGRIANALENQTSAQTTA